MAFQANAFQSDAFQQDAGGTFGFGQAQADIKATSNGFGQAQCDIKATNRGFGQAQCYIKGYGFGQSQADIKATNNAFGQANALILGSFQQFAQAQADVKATGYGFGQSQTDIKAVGTGYGQAQATIIGRAYGQANADIKATNRGYGQAQASIFGLTIGYGQAQASIKATNRGYGQANALINAIEYLIFDSFNRVEPNGSVGSPEIGPTWTESYAGSFNAAIVDGTDLVADADQNGGSAFIGLRGSISRRSVDIYFEFISDTDPVSDAFIEIDGRNGTTVVFSNPSGSNIRWDFPSGNYTAALLEDTKYSFKVRFLGPHVYFKYWIYGGLEPEWQFVSPTVGTTIVDGAIDLYLGHSSTGTSKIDVFTAKAIYYTSSGQAQALIASDTKIAAGQAQAQIGPYMVGPYGQAQALILALMDHLDDAYNYTLRNGTWHVSVDLTTFGTDPEDAEPAFSGSNPDWGSWDTFWGTNFPNSFLRFTLPIKSVVSIDTFRDLDHTHDTIIGILGAGPYDWISYGGNDDSDIVDTYESSMVVTLEAGSYILLVAEYSGVTDKTVLANISISDFVPSGSGQAQAFIHLPYGSGQAQAFITKNTVFGQAQADIKRANRGSGQAKASIRATGGKFGQAQALILKWAGYGQTQAYIRRTTNGYGQAVAAINRGLGGGQANADILNYNQKYGQTQAWISTYQGASGQAQARILRFRNQSYGQATALISSSIVQGWGQAQTTIKNKPIGQAQALIRKYPYAFAQAQTYIAFVWPTGLAQAFIGPPLRVGYGQAQVDIKTSGNTASGQAQAYVYRSQGYGQAQTVVIGATKSGQAQTLITNSRATSGQARVFIRKLSGVGQAQGYIKAKTVTTGLARVLISKPSGYAQAQAKIKLLAIGCGQAQVFIRQAPSGQAQAYISGDRYFVRFNSHTLPGYAQQENFDSVMNIVDHYNTEDSSLSEYLGLQNKIISLRMKTVGHTLAEAKEQIEEAGTIVRSKRSFAQLFVQYHDRYYLALTRSIKTENTAKLNTKTAEYTVEFEAKPWLIGTETHTVSGVGLIDTGTRALSNGGWTPTRLVLSGTDITVSGYTEAGDFTGFISVSGTVADLTLNSESYSATIGGVNKNSVMNNLDFALYAGPGKTFYEVTGATDCVINYEDRWYL